MTFVQRSDIGQFTAQAGSCLAAYCPRRGPIEIVGCKFGKEPIFSTSRSRNAHFAYQSASCAGYVCSNRWYTDVAKTCQEHDMQPTDNYLFQLTPSSQGMQKSENCRIRLPTCYPTRLPTCYPSPRTRYLCKLESDWGERQGERTRERRE